jgi:tRNA G46 methylase TrmB
MFGNSRTIQSNQPSLHPDLRYWVERAREGPPFRKPIASFNADAFARLELWLSASPLPWILDSGCGTGFSTCHLAEQFPQHRIVGVDRSEHRLSKAQSDHDRILWLRADLVDFWRLLAASPWRPEQHFLLYPNPYPKQQQLKQRWHAHPVFPAMLACSSRLICRTNWLIYAQELQFSLQIFGAESDLKTVAAKPPITPFERKYQASGHVLWEVTAKSA